jgi:hypothetical protein
MEKKGIDLNKLKEALDNGELFDGKDSLDKILKKSENIDNLSETERDDVMKKREERVEKEMEENKEEIMADIIKDNDERMKKRSEREKNEMTLSKIKFLENEIKIFEEMKENIEHELDMYQKKIDDINAQIKVLKKDIKK